MASIEAIDLSILFPLTGREGTKMSGARVPGNRIRVQRKEYIVALKNLSFAISKGQRVGLIGRNGSGKSTLLKVLSGIYAPTSGTLKSSGVTSSLFNLSLGVQPDATGLQNIIIRGLVKGWSHQEIQERIPHIVEFSELADVIELPIRTYSDGMRMRLLFAIATSFSPEILLLDEWIGAGDAHFQKKAAERMNGLVDKAGITVIASHNRNLVRNVCDLAIWLDQGHIRAFGPIESVYAEMDSYFRSIEG